MTEPPELPEIDVAKIYVMLKEMRGQILDAIKGVSGRVAIVESRTIGLKTSIERMASEYADTRVKRLEEEAEEAEREYGILKEQLKVIEQKVEQKKSATIGALTTSEKIKQSVTVSVEQEEERRRKDKEAIWKTRWNAVVTAVLVTTSVGFVGSVIAAILWWIRFYLENR